jgi:NRPS condensation-like uncharacterized protein
MPTLSPPSRRPPALTLAGMNRPLGPTEAIYYLLDQLYSLNFVVFAEVSGRLDAGGLERALQAVQVEQPLLRTHLAVVRGRACFKAVAPEQAALKAQVRPLRNWRAAVSAELDAPFAGEAPLGRFLWFRGRGKAVVAMVFHHTIADGKSGANLLIEVLRRAGGEDIPLNVRQPHPSAQDLDLIQSKGVVESSLQKLKYWFSQGQAALKFPKQLPGYDMRLGDQRSIKVIPFSLAVETAQALLAACRAHGTTVHGALGAAQVLALNAEFGSAQARQLGLTSLADLRGVLSGKLSASDLGLYVATITTVHGLAAKPDFWHLAADIRGQLQQVLTSGDANLVHSVYREDSLLPMGRNRARLIQSSVALAPPSSMLTNIGKVDTPDLRNGARIQSLAFLVSPPPQHPVCVTAASHGGRLHLNLLYDRVKLDDAQAQRITNTLVGFLEAAARGQLESAWDPENDGNDEVTVGSQGGRW